MPSLNPTSEVGQPLAALRTCLLFPPSSSISWKRGSEGYDASPLHSHSNPRIEFEMNTFHPPNEAGHALAHAVPLAREA